MAIPISGNDNDDSAGPRFTHRRIKLDAKLSSELDLLGTNGKNPARLAEVKQKLKEKYDTDGNGVFSEEEVDAMLQDFTTALADKTGLADDNEQLDTQVKGLKNKMGLLSVLTVGLAIFGMVSVYFTTNKAVDRGNSVVKNVIGDSIATDIIPDDHGHAHLKDKATGQEVTVRATGDNFVSTLKYGNDGRKLQCIPMSSVASMVDDVSKGTASSMTFFDEEGNESSIVPLAGEFKDVGNALHFADGKIQVLFDSDACLLAQDDKPIVVQNGSSKTKENTGSTEDSPFNRNVLRARRATSPIPRAKILDENRKRYSAAKENLAQGNGRALQDDPLVKVANGVNCLENFSVKNEMCSGDVFYEALETHFNSNESFSECDSSSAITRITGTTSLIDAKEYVDVLCAAAYAGMDRYPLEKIFGGNQMDLEAYFDGGTHFNYQNYQSEEFEQGKVAIDKIYNDQARKGTIEYPNFMKNFHDCDIPAVYCCFVQDRQARDNNGNCGQTGTHDCADADPGDNTDVCYHDFTDSPASSHVAGGFAIFRENDEGDVHCHGFAWGSDESDLDNLYKGNNLFYISYLDHLSHRGYIGQLPGAPLCGCAEQMPVVSRADCTEMDIEQVVVYEYQTDRAEQLTVHIANTAISFGACQGINHINNDLEAYFARLVDEGRADQDHLETLQGKLVGECYSAIQEFVLSKNL